MHDIVDVGVVADIDADLAAFPKPQHWTGHGAVVAKSLDHPPGGELEPQWRDPERVVRRELLIWVYAVPNAVPSAMPAAPAPIKNLRRGIPDTKMGAWLEGPTDVFLISLFLCCLGRIRNRPVECGLLKVCFAPDSDA